MNAPERSLSFDGDLCVGCHACEVACKLEHDLAAGVNRIRISATGPLFVNGRLSLRFECVRCRQCADPPCIGSCAEGAIEKRPDGIVLIDESLCIGCGSCVDACPYEALALPADGGTPQLCDLCYHRLDAGQEPFCVKHCMSGALTLRSTDTPAVCSGGALVATPQEGGPA